jgi:hypothetical protein
MTAARRALAALAAASLLGACAGSQPKEAAPLAPPPAERTPGADPAARANDPWPMKTHYVVDLWLHGFALITDDTSRVPLFRRGYRDEMVVEKNKRRLTTQLDTKHDSLAKFLAAHPQIAGAQFLVLNEHSWEALQDDIKTFLTVNGDPRKGTNQEQAQMIYSWSQLFPGAGDRRWLVIFVKALQDEHAKFYQAYWTGVQQARRPVLAAVDSMWVKVYLRRFRSFQEGTEQSRGDVYLSLPLGAEGRTILGGKRQNIIAVNYPATRDSAVTAMFVIAHEAVGNIAATAVRDNTTPNEVRAGLADRYLNAATVRGGAMLVQQIAPDRLAEYEAFYLTAAAVPFTPGQEALAFRTAFTLPDQILEAMRHSIEGISGGI